MTRILVVDDSEALRSQIRAILEAANFEVVEACNGKDGLDKIKLNPTTQLVLCDVNMPEMDGVSMCKALHKDPATNKIPIIMLTTEANAELKAIGKANGVVVWMTKPANAEKLVVIIGKVLGSSK